jgi:peptidoglycan/xylan/chitin deacetylase (PgdA/CDA1 family)
MPGTGDAIAVKARWTAQIAVTAAMLAALASCGGAGPASSPTPGRSPTSAASAPATVTPTATPGSPAPSTGPTSPSPAGAAPVGPPPVTGRLAGADWTYIPTTAHVVALTFDAGANADGVASILATLRRDDVPATFFLTGNFVRDFPSAARAIAAAGERIGDHTITHPHLTHLSDAAVRQQILGAAEQIAAVTGQNPAPLFRFPYGDADARTIAIANAAGYVPVRWTVDTLGWEGTAEHISASVVSARVLAALRPGEIVLMHVGSNPDDHTTFDADALPRVISELRARGYSFVTLDALTR